MLNNTGKTQRLVGMSIFTALVVVLQLIATFIKFGPFSITLALTPIVVGSALYGTKSGAWLGGVFGVVVLLMSITGAEVGGAALWAVNPILTAVLCILKGAAAGFAAGLVYNWLAKKHRTAAVFAAGIVSPVVNTGIFCAALVLFYRPTLAAWAGGTDVVYYIFFVLIGVNWLVEMAVNAVLSPVVVRIVEARMKGVV